MSNLNYNKVILGGRLTRDLTLVANDKIGTTTIAVNRRRKKGDEYIDEATFVDLKLFGTTLDYNKEKLLKGTNLLIEGTLEQENWEKDGQKRSRLVGVVERVTIVYNGKREDSLPIGENKEKVEPKKETTTPPKEDNPKIPF